MSYDTEETPEKPDPITMHQAMAFVQERLLNGLEQALLPEWEKQAKSKKTPAAEREDLLRIVKAAKGQAAILRTSIGALQVTRSLIALPNPPPDAPLIEVPGTLPPKVR